MLSTQSKLQYVVGAGVLALIIVGSVALVATERIARGGAVGPNLRIAQALLIVLMLLAAVLAWFAYGSLRTDLERRAESEAALRASESKFAGILEIAADAIISVDERQRIIHYNNGAERIFGWPAAEALGLPLTTLLPDRHREAHAANVRGFGRSASRARQMGERGVILGLRRDGSEFPAEASISKLELGSGEHIYTVVLRDVTDRHAREEADRRLHEAVSSLGETLEVAATERAIAQLPLDWLGDGALLNVHTGQGRLRRVASETVDPALARALRLVAAHSLDLDSPSRVVDVLRRGVAEHVAEVTDEWLEEHSADGDELARLRAVGMRSLLFLPLVAREHVLGVLTIFRVGSVRPFSVAEQLAGRELALRAAFALDNARLYEQAQQATIARDHALGVVSHDLRNPLSAIGMCARALLTASTEQSPDQRGLVGTILDSTELMQRMIRDLLDVASIEVGQLSVERREVNVGEVIARATSLFAREAEERGVTLTGDDVAEGVTIVGDEERLVQALSNLLGNAMRFTERGGSVKVTARTIGRELEISVADTGAGVPPSELPRIFERYWTVRGTAPKGGTGLGLAIARGIVEAHGGRLWAESEVGKGSIFRFTLQAP